MEYFLVCVASLLVSGLTLFSGFGLGTLLTPVMALFFPVEAAVAMTALVHFANNAFKLALYGRAANLRVLLRFGLPALLASLAGAWVLTQAAHAPALYAYEAFGRAFTVTPVKLLIGVLIAFFALLELWPKSASKPLPPAWLPLGGLLSGFFGGLSGHQGAFRSVFLLGSGLSKEAFIATGVVLACVVDVSRLSVYAGLVGGETLSGRLGLVGAAALCAFLGVFLGGRLLKKVSIQTLRRLVGALLLLLSTALCLGLA